MLPKIFKQTETITGATLQKATGFYRQPMEAAALDSGTPSFKYKADKYALKHLNEAQRLSDAIVLVSAREMYESKKRNKRK